MILSFIECPQAFSVNNNYTNWVAIRSGALNWFAPEPQPLRAGVDCRSDPEATGSSEKNAIQQVRFASAVESCDWDNPNLALNLAYDRNSLVVDVEF